MLFIDAASWFGQFLLGVGIAAAKEKATWKRDEIDIQNGETPSAPFHGGLTKAFFEKIIEKAFSEIFLMLLLTE